MQIEDKIKHCIIIINQLRADQQNIKYIIPQFHIAFKLIIQQAKQQSLNRNMLDKITKQFNEICHPEQTHKMQIAQVHQYMLDEINEILSQRGQMLSPRKIKRQPIFQLNNHKSAQSLEQIVIPQQTYYFTTPNGSELTLNSAQSLEQIVIPQQTYYFTTPNGSELTLNFPGQDPLPSRQNLTFESTPSFSVRNSQCDQIAERIQKLYSDHKLDEAYHQLSQYKKRMFLTNPNFKLRQDMKQLSDMVVDQYDQMTYNYQFFHEPGYVADKEEKGVKMLYKIYEEVKEVAVRVEAELDICLENFMCIVSEIDLFQEYIPFTYDTKLLEQVSRNKKIGRSKINVPLLSDRYAYFYAAAYDRLSTTNSIFFFSKTITSDKAFQQKLGYRVQKDPNLVELQYKFYIMEYVPLTPTRGKITLATNVNMRLSFLPLFVINKTCRVFAFDYFKNIMKVNKQFKGSEWEKKMKENSQVYEYFRERINQYLQYH